MVKYSTSKTEITISGLGLTGTTYPHTHRPGVLDDTNGATDADGVYRCTHTHQPSQHTHNTRPTTLLRRTPLSLTLLMF